MPKWHTPHPQINEFMKTRIFTTAAVALTALLALAGNDMGIGDTAEKCLANLEQGKRPMFFKSYSKASAANESEEFVYRDVTLTKGGELASVLGDDAVTIDSLVVRGPVNGEDFNTMRVTSLMGGLAVINLQYADIENKIVPESAFFDFDDQFDGEGAVYIMRLQRIILPEYITEIGDYAFEYAVNLKTINFPQALKRIGDYSFYTCTALTAEKIVFPEGMETIGKSCFEACKGMRGEIVLPSTIRELGDASFRQCWASKMNFPASLEEIGYMAFAGSRLEEVYFEGPSHLVFDPVGCQFYANYELKKIRLPEGLTTIPTAFLQSCIYVESVELPSTLETIESDAFDQCFGLKTLELPEGLRRIESGGLASCRSLTYLVLPSTLEFLAVNSCEGLSSLKWIYSTALIPPTCYFEDQASGFPKTAFGTPFESSTPMGITVYVPRGTYDLYYQSIGWRYFNTFVETDDVPSTAITNVTASPQNDGDDTIYDLMGRKVTNPIKGNLYIKGGKKYIHR